MPPSVPTLLPQKRPREDVPEKDDLARAEGVQSFGKKDAVGSVRKSDSNGSVQKRQRLEELAEQDILARNSLLDQQLLSDNVVRIKLWR